MLKYTNQIRKHLLDQIIIRMDLIFIFQVVKLISHTCPHVTHSAVNITKICYLQERGVIGEVDERQTLMFIRA